MFLLPYQMSSRNYFSDSEIHWTAMLGRIWKVYLRRSKFRNIYANLYTHVQATKVSSGIFLFHVINFFSSSFLQRHISSGFSLQKKKILSSFPKQHKSWKSLKEILWLVKEIFQKWKVLQRSFKVLGLHSDRIYLAFNICLKINFQDSGWANKGQGVFFSLISYSFIFKLSQGNFWKIQYKNILGT